MSEEQVNKTIDDELHSEQQLEKFLRTATPASIRYRLTKIPTGINEQIDYLNRLLKVISELDVEPVHVFSMLESVRPVVYEKFTAMTSRFLGKQTAFPPRVQLLLGQAAALQGHLASCYDNVVEEAQFHGDSQAFIIGSAVQRAMADKANLLLCYLQLYLPVPQQLWRQFNKLYVTAHKYKLLGQVTPDPILFSTKPLNLKHTYLYAMMLGCADASHFNVTEITALSNALKEWVSQITIVEKPDANPAQLGINLDTSSPPVFKPDIKNPTTSNVIYLQLDKLIKYLQNPAVSRLNQATPPPPQELVDKVIDAWTVHRPKSTDRIARTDDIICTLGFSNVHYYLMGGKDITELSAKLPLPEVEPIGKLVYGDIPREFNFHTLKPGEPGILASRNTCHEIRVIDESPTGYCLEWPADALSLLSIGEVIGLKERTSPYWKVGEINWMKKTEEGMTRTGILLLSTEAIPLLGRTPKGLSTNKGQYFSALLLPAESTLNRTKVEALIPAINLQMGEKFWVTQESSKHALQLMTALKQKSTVCHFECAYIVGAG